MSDTTPPSRSGRRIFELSDAAPLTGDELIPISQGRQSKKITLSELVAFAIAQHQASSEPHSQYEVGDVEAVYIAAQQPGE